jgi:hypothetical protein
MPDCNPEKLWADMTHEERVERLLDRLIHAVDGVATAIITRDPQTPKRRKPTDELAAARAVLEALTEESLVHDPYSATADAIDAYEKLTGETLGKGDSVAEWREKCVADASPTG